MQPRSIHSLPFDVLRFLIFPYLNLQSILSASRADKFFEAAFRPELINFLKNKRIKSVISSQHINALNTILQTHDGEVWAFGTNDYGELGLPDGESINTPRKILSGVQSIVSQSNSTFFIMMDQRVMVSGAEQLRLTGQHNAAPTFIPNLLGVTNITTDIHRTTLFVMDDGSVRKTGRNRFGGDVNDDSIVVIPSLSNVSQLETFDFYNHVALHNDGTISIAYKDTFDGGVFRKINNVNNVKKVVHEHLLLNDGSVHKINKISTDHFSVERVAALEDIIDISYCYGIGSFFIKSDGTVYSLGLWNEYGPGQSWRDKFLYKLIPNLSGVLSVHIDYGCIAFLLKNGNIVLTGSRDHDFKLLEGINHVQSLSVIKSIRNGKNYSFKVLVDKNGYVFIGGDNHFGQLGCGTVAEIGLSSHRFFSRYQTAVTLLEKRDLRTHFGSDQNSR